MWKLGCLLILLSTQFFGVQLLDYVIVNLCDEIARTTAQKLIDRFIPALNETLVFLMSAKRRLHVDDEWSFSFFTKLEGSYFLHRLCAVYYWGDGADPYNPTNKCMKTEHGLGVDKQCPEKLEYQKEGPGKRN